MPAPHALPITVSEADRLTLPSWARRSRTAQALAPRARIVLAAAECSLGIPRRRELARGVYRSTYALERAIRQYVAAANAEAEPFVSTRTADEILASFARLCLRTRN